MYFIQQQHYHHRNHYHHQNLRYYHHHESDQVCSLLDRPELKPELKDENGRTALHVAAWFNKVVIINSYAFVYDDVDVDYSIS